MRLVILGLLIGLGLGSVVSIGAQPLEPCVHAWILWSRDRTHRWGVHEAFESKSACEPAARGMNYAYFKDSVEYTCYPDTFDPRRKK
jgi:hypothetical protein